MWACFDPFRLWSVRSCLPSPGLERQFLPTRRPERFLTVYFSRLCNHGVSSPQKIPTIEQLRCSGGEVVGSFSSSSSSAEGSVSFTVGITEVQTMVEEGNLGYLSDMYFGGYDVDSSGTGILFSREGR